MSKDKKLPKLKILKNNIWILKKIWKYAPGYMLMMIIDGFVWGTKSSIDIIYVKKLFDALGNGTDFSTVANIILTYALYILVFYIYHNWHWEVYNVIGRKKIHMGIHLEMLKQAVAIDLEKYDDPEFYNDFVWAMNQAYTHVVGVAEVVNKVIMRIVATVTVTGVLFSVDKLMAVIVFIISAIRVAVTLYSNKIRLKYREELNALSRKSGYVNRVFTLPDYAKELRVSDVKHNLIDMLDKTADEKKTTVDKYGKVFSITSFITNGVAMSGEIGLIILMLYRVMVVGDVGLGGFAVAINATWKMSWFVRDLVDRILKYHEHGIFVEKIITFMNCKPKIIDGKLKAGQFESLEIKNLSFGYDDSKSALDNVSLKINRGEKIAIVGYNGAGKTTLTKLIMRLYDATDGEILYNGKNLKEYTVSSIRDHVAAVFQDYKIFAATLAENVAGFECDENDKIKVRAALEKSSFSDKLETLDDGLDTMLTREFDNNGTQLSGGEQQKVAIARAFYKDADLIILDEPSSALDPDAEYELNKSISDYTDSKTVIFISHRLSTTRHADRINMFDNGRLIESGTHEELIKQDGKYAYMFNLQAEKYRQN